MVFLENIDCIKDWMRIQTRFDPMVDPTYTTEVITFLSRREAPSIAKKKSRNPFNEQIEKKSAMVFL